MQKKALIIVDVQNDFCPNGALPVPNGDEVVPVINSIINEFDLVVATKDWHPENHISFAKNHPGKKVGDVVETENGIQILWPEHCVQNTHGAEFAEGLLTNRINKIIYKGTDPKIDSYSGFFDNHRKNKTELDDYLKSNGVSDIYITGLATDYCVKFTALDGLSLGYKVYIIKNAVRGVDLNKGDSEKSLMLIEEKGGKIINNL